MSKEPPKRAAEPPKPTMQLMNVIIAFDTYCVTGVGERAESNAIEAVIDLIRSGEIGPSHFKALTLRASPVRPQCQEQRPAVSADVSDADFEILKGKTTQEVYDLLNKHPNGQGQQ